MRDIALFGEDHAHEQVIGALVRRVAGELGVEVRLDWRSATGGHARVVGELGGYLRDLRRQEGPLPDLIVVAIDANCKGLNERTREVSGRDAPAPSVLAIPDPHIERWLLLDGAAFRAVFGTGCDAPDLKCDRRRYKQLLIRAIVNAGVTPSLGGIEYAEDIVMHLDIVRVAQADRSFCRFVDELRSRFLIWRR